MNQSPTPTDKKRRWLGLAVRGVVLLAVGVWLFRGTAIESLASSLDRIPTVGILAAVCIGLLNMSLAGLRWSTLMNAFGARYVPSVWSLIQLFFVGQFYNTFVPGSVGGDLIRGYVSRRCFQQSAASFAVIVAERLLGLSALGVIFLVGYSQKPDIIPIKNPWYWAFGLSAIVVVIALSGLLSQRLRSVWRSVPRLERPVFLVHAFLISLIGHGATVSIFMVFAHWQVPQLEWTTLSLIIPLALIASIVPIAIVGIGPREAALVGLLGLVDVAKADALALSLSFALLVIVLAGFGGIIQLVFGAKLSGLLATDAGDTNQSFAKDLPQD